MKCIKLIPYFKDYLWGGEKLKTEFNKKTDIEPLAESWELSCHENGLSRLEINSNITLKNYIENNDKDILGENARKFDKFPVLLKLIDAKDNLSIQVHPDDKYALKNENQYGKTEAWYVLSAEKGAKIIYGLKNNVSSEEFRRHVKNNTLLNIVNQVKVKSGDVFLIKPGILHAIGKGIVIAEIQQNSDITYRVYDYGRKDINGNKRQLNIDKACEVISFEVSKEKTRKSKVSNTEYTYENLVESKYFKLNKIEIKSKYQFHVTIKSFICLLCVDGFGKIIEAEGVVPINKGESVFFPAGEYSFNIIGECIILECKI